MGGRGRDRWGVDSIGFAALAACVGQVNWRQAARRALPVPLLVAGVLAGSLLVEGALRRGAGSPRLPALRRAGNTGVRATHVSGMLTNFAEEGAAWGLWLWGRTRGRGLRRLRLALRVSPRRDPVRKMGLFGGLRLAFLLGATRGSIGQGRWHWDALGLPRLGLTAVSWPSTSGLLTPRHRSRRSQDHEDTG